MSRWSESELGRTVANGITLAIAAVVLTGTLLVALTHPRWYAGPELPEWTALIAYAACLDVGAATQGNALRRCEAERRRVYVACVADAPPADCERRVSELETDAAHRALVLDFHRSLDTPRVPETMLPTRGAIVAFGTAFVLAGVCGLRRRWTPREAVRSGMRALLGAAAGFAPVALAVLLSVPLAPVMGETVLGLPILGMMVAPWVGAVATPLLLRRREDGAPIGKEFRAGVLTAAVGVAGWQLWVGPLPTPASAALATGCAALLALAGYAWAEAGLRAADRE